MDLVDHKGRKMENKMNKETLEFKKELETKIPVTTIETIKNYVLHGLKPGSFTTAVLENNLIGALYNADSNNSKSLREIMEWIQNFIPILCWGSKEAVEAWLSGKNGFADEEQKNRVKEMMDAK